MKTLIAAGGTAGHVIPALCVADQLKSRGVEVEFVGGDRAEVDLVPAAGYPFHQIAAEGISRTNPLKAARAVIKAVGSLFTAWRLIGRVSPDVVMGGGGYIAGPVGFIAVLRRVPLVLTEADSHLGITNRLLARFAKRVCLALPLDGKEDEKFLVTGRPVPPIDIERSAARARWKVSDQDRLVAIFGGSLGARSINQAAVAAFEDEKYRVVHISGRRDFASLTAPGESYELLEYLDHEAFVGLLVGADLVVGRSGGSVFELAAVGVPAVLVPYPHASGDHQTENARWMEAAGAATVLPDEGLNAERLRAAVDAAFDIPGALSKMAQASRSLARPRAAADIAEQIITIS